jgi:hypothetical protein
MRDLTVAFENGHELNFYNVFEDGKIEKTYLFTLLLHQIRRLDSSNPYP